MIKYIDNYRISHTDLVWLEVEHDQVSVTDVEARQVITGVLGIKYVLVHNKCCSFGLSRIAPVNKHKNKM